MEFVIGGCLVIAGVCIGHAMTLASIRRILDGDDEE